MSSSRQTTNNASVMDRHMLSVFRYSYRALQLVWQTSKGLTIGLAIATLLAGVLPAGVAYVGQLIVDAVVTAMAHHQATGEFAYQTTLNYVVLEAILILAISATSRTLFAQQSLLRAMLGQKVNVLILEKAQSLSLRHFEDSEFYDKLVRARREASSRPLALVNKTFSLLQNAITLSSFAFLLWQFSPWALLVLTLGALPAFVAEAKFSGDAFRLFRWRSPETRMQNYLETLLAREDNIKEVRLYQLGAIFLQRYKAIFHTLFAEDRRLTLRREWWGFLLSIVSTCVFYGAYIWIVSDTIRGQLSLGQMTMYLLLFKQGQTAVTNSLSAISGMYEDNLYLSNLYEYLEQPTDADQNLPMPDSIAGDGIRFESVYFRYPGAQHDALTNINLHLLPGTSLAIVGENGSGKTTLIKLLTRLYQPTAGRILLDGVDLQVWPHEQLLTRIGVIFQDFVRYQLSVGENIGVGDAISLNEESRWQTAAQQGMAHDFIKDMPQQYHTQLGRWFKDGQELSGGQWQKIALARAFMRHKADILVLDEPTAAMDAQAEATIFEHFQTHTQNKMAILISHRFSTVRLASQIIVMQKGAILEAGDHAELLAQNGIYARLFNLQAKAYQ